MEKICNKKYLFIGVRSDVLKYMLTHLEHVVAILPKQKKIKNQYLKRFDLGTKQEVVQIIEKTDFDILVSNGCPYILPVSRIKKSNQIFINLHPSLLPNLKGLHPINGAIYFQQTTGATCHIMDDSVDGGKIISQVPIYNDSSIHLPLLYQMCFLAEVKAFKLALNQNFLPLDPQPQRKGFFFDRDMIGSNICLDTESSEEIVRKTNSLAISNQYAKIHINGSTKKVFSAKIIKNIFLENQYKSARINTIVLTYENFLLIRRDQHFLELNLVSGENLE